MHSYERWLEDKIIAQRKERPAVIFTEAFNADSILAALRLIHLIRPIFLASEAAVRSAAVSKISGLESKGFEYLISESVFAEIDQCQDLLKEFASDYQKFCREKQCFLSFEQAVQSVSNPGLFGVMSVRFGYADIAVGGADQKYSQYGIHVSSLLSLDNNCITAGFAAPQSSEKLTFFADLGKSRTADCAELLDTLLEAAAVIKDIVPDDQRAVNAVLISGGAGSEDSLASVIDSAEDAFDEFLQDKLKESGKYENIKLLGRVSADEFLDWQSTFYNEKHIKGQNASENRSVLQRLEFPCLFISPSFDLIRILYRQICADPAAVSGSFICGVGSQSFDASYGKSCESMVLSMKILLHRLLNRPHYFLSKSGIFFSEHCSVIIRTELYFTEVNICRGRDVIFCRRISHSGRELEPFSRLAFSTQADMRFDKVMDVIENCRIPLEQIEAVVCGSGYISPVSSGIYRVNQTMYDETYRAQWGDYAENLAILVGKHIADAFNAEAYIINPDVVDEMLPRASIVGFKGMRRRCISKAGRLLTACRRYASEHKTFYEELNLIAADIDSQISAAALKRGRYADGNNIMDGDGPFSLESSGTLPSGALIDLCFSQQYTHAQLHEFNKTRGGMRSLLNTSDLAEIEKMCAEGSQEALEAVDAMAYGAAKSMTALVPAFDGERPDAFIICGRAAGFKPLIDKILNYISAFNADTAVYSEDLDILCMTDGICRALDGREPIKNYTGRA